MTFQEIIRKLTAFWAKQGCLIQQGHDVEVGAGTFNPATFLRSLGPEPYNTVYVEPSRRPQDGRFGDNPNRTQLFHQLQVIMKPSPKEIQKLYLKSLETLGFNLKQHDIRFVHDDWESPTLGAWGLGWEVWMDGMEVTQFTYFQSVAGYTLKPISVELTYGLERLSMIVQKKDNFFDMQYNEQVTYGDIYHRNEVEWSHYNFYKASTEMWLRHFEDFEREAKALVEVNLPIPAYDFVMKASHAFNMLEARGVLSVTERTGYITRVRDLAKAAATEYLVSREKLGFPLLKQLKKEPPTHSIPPLPETFNPKETSDFLFEIGSEELPATFVPIGNRNLKSAIEKLLKEHKLTYSGFHIYGTLRRLSILVNDLIHGTEDSADTRRGPPVSTAYDAQGHATKQGMGFFKSLGFETPPTLQEIKKHNTLHIQEIKGSDYLMATLEKKGVSTIEILSQALPKIISDLPFPKKMRWSGLDTLYARPLQWVVALLGNTVIPFEIAGIASGNLSAGHAQLCDEAFPIESASDYVARLEEHKVMVDIEKRKSVICQELEAIEKETNTLAVFKEKVLSQVLYLTEWPELTYASFDKAFLKAPQEVLTSEMVEHQKYFPLMSHSGHLAPLFVITADNTPSEVIKEGNQNVLSARLSDGVFLYEEDLKTSMDDFAKKLENIIFQKELGTMAEKVDRLKRLALILAQALEVGSEKTVLRAASLCKADIASELVQEFPDLQGTIGKHYALHQKEEEEVAIAIEEHWLPKSEGGALPESRAGILLSLADKLDNLISYFKVGLKPTSSSDPYALRRQAIGVIKILIENNLSLDLQTVIKDQEVLNFLTARAKGVLEDYDFQKDEIEASLQGLCTNPYDQFLKTQALNLFRASDHFNGLFEVYKRAKGQIGKEKLHTIKPDLFLESAEKSLYESLATLKKPFKEALSSKNYQGAFEHLSTLRSPLATLFEEVKILADEPKIRTNRIALLQEVFSYFSLLLDFGRIQNI
ncbi:glycine--tRNA ligase subunit beta [Candidatus Neptunichlamydia sp. REUL1]|uniref:glycine--tRNA ligase subunit beta n=1 Tax=Candidatus Neptunichlamydia sp. REUL1 TaxID=3064277 RepID=UPI002A4E2DA6|nr:glycine--tRNA ligase subunit beta [Candidatus Neptunochlamydia sp. REUL1]